jgi:hypothetical protein
LPIEKLDSLMELQKEYPVLPALNNVIAIAHIYAAIERYCLPESLSEEDSFFGYMLLDVNLQSLIEMGEHSRAKEIADSIKDPGLKAEIGAQ